MINETDIAIIGGGTSGLSCALELKRLGCKNVTVFEREEECGGAPRHCGHKGFGIAEFKQLLTGGEYAKKLYEKALKNQVDIKTLHSAYKLKEDNILYFTTPKGVVKYKAKKIIFATGVRETPRSSRLIGGMRSHNIITTGALQRFLYINKRVPFKSATIIGSEDVSFSALFSLKKHDIAPKGMLEKKSNIQTYSLLKPVGKYIFKTDIYTGIKEPFINCDDKKVKNITFKKNDKEKEISCEGIICSGGFVPESFVLRKYFLDTFNFHNDSPHITQNFQTKSKDIYLTGNVIRGALSSYSCYYEAKKCAKAVYDAFKKDKVSDIVDIEADEAIEWYYPSMIDVSNDYEVLTYLKLKESGNYKIEVLLNDKVILIKNGYFKSYQKIKIPKLNVELKSGSKIYIKTEKTI
jgi:thioredoxin reductase